MLSVTVNVTLKLPGSPNACWTVRPDAVSPSPKLHCHWTIVPVMDLLSEPSKLTLSRTVGAFGVKVKSAVTLPCGGTVVPLGTRRIVTNRAVALPKSVPIGVTTTLTLVVGAGPAGAGGRSEEHTSE